jgi:hypothetical protein
MKWIAMTNNACQGCEVGPGLWKDIEVEALVGPSVRTQGVVVCGQFFLVALGKSLVGME